MDSSKLTRLALTVSLGGFLFGFDASVISGVVAFITPFYELNDFQIGLVVGAPTLGGIIAASCVSPLSDKFGRKPMLYLIAILYAVSAVVSVFTPNYEILVLARFIGGLGFGSLSLAPIYITEIAPPAKRGRLVSFNQLNIVIGFSVAYFANYLLLNLSHHLGEIGNPDVLWRWMLAVEIIPAVVYVFLLKKIPESPRWLRLNGRVEEANAIYESSFGIELCESLDTAKAEDALAPLKERLAALFHSRMRFVLMVGVILAVAQQITGINAIFFYAPSIFEQSGVGTNAAFTQAVWIGIINVVFTLLAMWAIDHYGRKPLLIIGLSGIFLSMSLCAYQFHQAKYVLDKEALSELSQSMDTKPLEGLVGQRFDDDVSFKNQLISALGEIEAKRHEAAILKLAIEINAKAFLVGILVFVASFACSLGPVMWVMLPEIFPNHLRGVAMATTGLINSMVSFGVQFLFPWQLANIGASITFLLYAIFAVFGLVFILRYLPETKGKSLEEIEQHFHKAS